MPVEIDPMLPPFSPSEAGLTLACSGERNVWFGVRPDFFNKMGVKAGEVIILTEEDVGALNTKDVCQNVAKSLSGEGKTVPNSFLRDCKEALKGIQIQGKSYTYVDVGLSGEEWSVENITGIDVHPLNFAQTLCQSDNRHLLGLEMSSQATGPTLAENIYCIGMLAGLACTLVGYLMIKNKLGRNKSEKIRASRERQEARREEEEQRYWVPGAKERYYIIPRRKKGEIEIVSRDGFLSSVHLPDRIAKEIGGFSIYESRRNKDGERAVISLDDSNVDFDIASEVARKLAHFYSEHGSQASPNDPDTY